MNWNGDPNPIRHACQVAGCYTVSAGTSSPAVMLSRLLDALGILDPKALCAITEPGGKYASVPLDALRDGSDAWWGTEEADALLRLLFASINAAAPEGFACIWGEDDRIDLSRIESPCTAEEFLSHAPPQISVLRARVRPQR